MKAIRVPHTGGPEVMELVEVPMPQPTPTEAVVKISVAGVNTIDGHFRDGSLRTPLPFIPGQEGAGVVTAVGTQTAVYQAVCGRSHVFGAGAQHSAPRHPVTNLHGIRPLLLIVLEFFIFTLIPYSKDHGPYQDRQCFFSIHAP